MTQYKRLTPKLREELIKKLNNQIGELQECDDNVLVTAQIIALKQTKSLIRSLPDGYPLPMKE